jgi:hypothetical protein
VARGPRGRTRGRPGGGLAAGGIQGTGEAGRIGAADRLRAFIDEYRAMLEQDLANLHATVAKVEGTATLWSTTTTPPPCVTSLGS